MPTTRSPAGPSRPHAPSGLVHGLGALAIALACATSPAQTSWQRTNLGSRTDAVMSWDPAGNRVLLFGGLDVLPGGSSSSPTDETWVWDGSGDWTRLTLTHSPPAVGSGAMATDTARNTILLHLGPGATWEWGPQGDWFLRQAGGPARAQAIAYDANRRASVAFDGTATWEWDGTLWRSINTANTPPSPLQAAHALAFDAARGEVLLLAKGLGAAETWTYDGVDWTQRNPATVPSGSFTPVMGYDATRQRVVLRAATRTWTWDGRDWTLADASQSGTRIGHSMAWDDRAGELLLFGGEDSLPQRFNDTYAWTGSGWIGRGAPNPDPRSDAAAVYDPRHRRTLFLGGSNTFGFNDVWAWSDGRWQQLPGVPPGRLGRSLLGVAYDTARNEVILFGGTESPGPGGDDSTWIFDGSTWRSVAPVAGMGERFGHGMTYDPIRDRTVLFGGNDPLGVGWNDQTWEWDGTTWTQRLPSNRPPPPPYGFGVTASGRMTWDADRQRIVLLAGNALWEWDGTDWSQRATSGTPPAGTLHFDTHRRRLMVVGTPIHELVGNTWTPRSSTRAPIPEGPCAAFDEARGRLVLLNGDQVWDYGPDVPADVRPLGPGGCAGSAGPAGLEVVPGRGPWLGDTFEFTVLPLPMSTQSVVVLLGASPSSWGGLPLPVDLGLAGMPGCLLRSSSDVALTAPAAQGAARVALPIPNDPVLLGRRPVVQALVPDPVVNPLGAILSDAVRATLGAK